MSTLATTPRLVGPILLVVLLFVLIGNSIRLTWFVEVDTNRDEGESVSPVGGNPAVQAAVSLSMALLAGAAFAGLIFLADWVRPLPASASHRAEGFQVFVWYVLPGTLLIGIAGAVWRHWRDRDYQWVANGVCLALVGWALARSLPLQSATYRIAVLGVGSLLIALHLVAYGVWSGRMEGRPPAVTVLYAAVPVSLAVVLSISLYIGI